MNDFTKEELQELLSKLQGTLGPLSMDDLPRLAMKIKYMVDNYCEHPASKSFINCGVEYCVQCKQEIK